MTYVDLGATATDSVGKSLMPDLVSSNVDTSKAGTYQVVWSAHDGALNYATTTRDVIVTDPTAVAPVATTTETMATDSSVTTDNGTTTATTTTTTTTTSVTP